MPNAKCQMPNAKCQMHKCTNAQMPNAKCQMPNAQCQCPCMLCRRPLDCCRWTQDLRLQASVRADGAPCGALTATRCVWPVAYAQLAMLVERRGKHTFLRWISSNGFRWVCLALLCFWRWVLAISACQRPRPSLPR